MTKIPANVPTIGAPKAFTPGVLIVESVLTDLEPMQMGHAYQPPLIPFDQATEPFVKTRTVSRFGPRHVEILTLRYEAPHEQVRRLEWEEKALAAPCGECGESRGAHSDADGPSGIDHEWAIPLLSQTEDPAGDDQSA